MTRVTLLNRVDRVLLGDVDDLVREDAGELRLVLDQPEQALGDVDEAAGRRKRVDTFGVEHDELPGEAAAAGSTCASTAPTSVTYLVTSASW